MKRQIYTSGTKIVGGKKYDPDLKRSVLSEKKRLISFKESKPYVEIQWQKGLAPQIIKDASRDDFRELGLLKGPFGSSEYSKLTELAEQCGGSIQNGLIVDLASEKHEQYDPFSLEKPILIDFLRIDENDNRSIKDFIKNYGFLKIGQTIENLNPLGLTIDLLDSYKVAVIQFKQCAKLYSYFQAQDIAKLEMAINEFQHFNLPIEYLDMMNNLEKKEDHDSAIIKVASLLLHHGLATFPDQPFFGTGNINHNFLYQKEFGQIPYRSILICPNLFTYIKLQFIWLIENKQNLGQCLECKNYFELTRSHKEFCNKNHYKRYMNRLDRASDQLSNLEKRFAEGKISRQTYESWKLLYEARIREKEKRESKK